MEKIFSKVAVALCVMVSLSAPWAMFLGAEGMELFWATVLCSVALYVIARREFVASPWSIVVGMLLSWWLLKTGSYLLPEDNALRHGSEQLGVSLRDMTRVRDVSFVTTVAFFFARAIALQREFAAEAKEQASPRYRAVRIPPDSETMR